MGMFGKRKKICYCELCSKELVGFFEKNNHNNKIYCYNCYKKVKKAEKEEEKEAILRQPPAKFNPQEVERITEHEIVFRLNDAPIKFHIFFLMEFGECGECLLMTFLGVDRFSGRPALVTWDQATEYTLHKVWIHFLSQEQFNDILSQYPSEVGRLFEGFTPENWQDYQNVTKTLNLDDKCIILFRENDGGRVEIVVHSESVRPHSRPSEYMEYIETSIEKFEKWREKKSLLDMVTCFDQLRENIIPYYLECVFHSEFDKRGMWENINTGVNEIVENYNCVIMMDRSRFVCTNKLSQEDVDSIFNKVKTKYLKSYFNNKK